MLMKKKVFYIKILKNTAKVLAPTSDPFHK
jgi:hypothetical protein